MEAVQIVRLEKVVEVDTLQEAANEVHKDVSQGQENRRIRPHKLLNVKKNVLPCNFRIGDYVLARHIKQVHKLQSKWHGPMCIVDGKSDLELW